MDEDLILQSWIVTQTEWPIIQRIRRHQAKATVTEVHSDSELAVFMLLIIFVQGY